MTEGGIGRLTIRVIRPPDIKPVLARHFASCLLRLSPVVKWKVARDWHNGHDEPLRRAYGV